VRRSGSRYGNGFRRTPLTMLKIAVLEPTPRATMVSVTNVKAGRPRKVRKA
jgi:hypothetical protein